MVFCDSENVIKILSESRHVRVCIIISFLVQAFLTIFATSRKCLGGKWGIFSRFLIWLAYLLADWIAIFTIGSISLINLIRSSSEHHDIQVFWFWAPFLLLHLGGPDTITAFALQDNELWVRHLVGFIFQIGSTLYVFLGSLPHNKLWPPTLLVLIAGIIKYAERIYTFYLASFDHFGDNWVCGENLDFYYPVEEETNSSVQRGERTAGTDQNEGAAGLRIPAQFKNLGTSDRLHELPKKLTIGELPCAKDNIHQYFAASNPESIVKAAVYLFGTIRRPLVGSFLSRAQLWKSFANLGSQNKKSSAKEALQKIEIELSLLYEVLHTKWPVVVSKFGFLYRTLDIGCIVGAFVLFALFKKQNRLEEFDTWLTYCLLIGALALDFISLILLFVLSDWFFIAHFRKMGSKSVEDFVNRRSRWSKTVPQLNFITYVVNNHPSRVKKCLSLLYPCWLKRLAKQCISWVKKWLHLSCLSCVKTCLPMGLCLYWVEKCLHLFYPSWAKKCLSWVKKLVRVTKCLSLSSQNFIEDTYWRCIFEQVESFSKISTQKKNEEEESPSEGRQVLMRRNGDWFTMIIDILGDPSKVPFVDPWDNPERNFHGEIFLEDLFEDPAQHGRKNNLCDIRSKYDFTRSLLILHTATELFLQDGPPPPSSSSGSNDHRATCKILSDYLFYLAMMESTMIAPMLDSWEKVLGDTYEETKSFLDQSSSEKHACTKILSVDDLKRKQERKEESKGSVLNLARELAEVLKNRYHENGYDQNDDLCKMLSRVWVHLMAHIASNCEPNVHAKQPSKGGELLTFIWLCIANCGDKELNRMMTRIELV